MIRYLLGELSEQETTQFEEKYFSDDGVFEELRFVETELVDAYVRGELSESEKQQFEGRYLNGPERKEKVESARRLLAVLAHIPRPEPVASKGRVGWRSMLEELSSVPVWARIGYSTAGLAILAFALVVLVQNRSLRSESGRMRLEHAAILNRNQELERQVARLSEAGGRPTPDESGEKIAQLQTQESLIASIRLRPGSPRSAVTHTSNELVIPRTARWVVLSLSLGSDREYPNGYRAIVETASGDEIERVDRLKSRTASDEERVVEVQLSAELLSSDAYIVRLLGCKAKRSEEEVDDYTFQVVKR
jgi:hypothetical protein